MPRLIRDTVLTVARGVEPWISAVEYVLKSKGHIVAVEQQADGVLHDHRPSNRCPIVVVLPCEDKSWSRLKAHAKSKDPDVGLYFFTAEQ